MTRLRTALLSVFLCAGLASFAAVDFPGPTPGLAGSSQANGVFTLENAVISGSWRFADGQLHPLNWTDKLTGRSYAQSGAELFRLGLKPPANQPAGVVVAIRLEAERVAVLASYDGSTWTELAAYPRAEFPGQPGRVRLGKMNLLAQSKDY
jgi:hypothetical protein